MSSAFTSKNKPTAKKASKTFSGNKTWFIFAIIAAVAAIAVVFGVLSQAVATTTYYVLSQNVPANSQIMPTMLKEVVTSQGGQPRNALSVGDVTQQPTYAKYALNTGDIVTASNTGALTPLTEGIPANFTVASFSAEAQNAVAGKLSTGNYIDVIAVNDQGGNGAVAKTVLRHVLLLDVATDPSKIGDTQSSTTTTDTMATDANVSTQDQLRQGIPSLYTVTLTPQDALKLALVRDSKIFITLSPKENSDKSMSAQDYQDTLGNVFGSAAVGDSGAGTLKKATDSSTAKPSASATTPPAAPTADPASTDQPTG